MGGCLQLVVYYYFYTAPPHPHPQCQHNYSHAHMHCVLYAHAGTAQRAILLLPCTCSCDAPNGNAADIDSSIMRLSAGVTVLVYLGGTGIYFIQVQVLPVHVYIFLMPVTTPVVPALKMVIQYRTCTCSLPVWPTAQLPGYCPVTVRYLRVQ
jgi:hypothetical protein